MLNKLRLTLWLAIIPLGVIACSADSGQLPGPDAGPDGTMPDAQLDAQPTRTCHFPEELGDLALNFEGRVLNQQLPDDPDALYAYLVAEIDPRPPHELATIQLYPGFGVFDPELVTGSFSFEGVETDFYTCGACVVLFGNEGALDQQYYVPSSGTLNLSMASTVAGTTVEGSLENVTLRQVILDDEIQMQTDVADPCSVTIDTLTFTATLTEASAR